MGKGASHGPHPEGPQPPHNTVHASALVRSGLEVHSGARPGWGPLKEAARTERAGGKAKLGVSCELQA